MNKIITTLGNDKRYHYGIQNFEDFLEEMIRTEERKVENTAAQGTKSKWVFPQVPQLCSKLKVSNSKEQKWH